MYQKQMRINTNIEISLLDTAPQIHQRIYAPLLDHTDSISTKLLSSKIFKIEAQ